MKNQLCLVYLCVSFLVSSLNITASNINYTGLRFSVIIDNSSEQYEVGELLGAGNNGSVFELNPKCQKNPFLVLKIFYQDSEDFEIEKQLHQALLHNGLTKIVFYEGRIIDSKIKPFCFQIKTRLFGKTIELSDLIEFPDNLNDLKNEPLKFTDIAYLFRDFLLELSKAEITVSRLHEGNLFYCNIENRLEIIDGELIPFIEGINGVLRTAQIAFMTRENFYEYYDCVKRFFPELLILPGIKKIGKISQISEIIQKQIFDFYLSYIYDHLEFTEYLERRSSVLNSIKNEHHQKCLLSYGSNYNGKRSQSLINENNWYESCRIITYFDDYAKEQNIPNVFLFIEKKLDNKKDFIILDRCYIYPNGELNILPIEQ